MSSLSHTHSKVPRLFFRPGPALSEERTGLGEWTALKRMGKGACMEASLGKISTDEHFSLRLVALISSLNT